MKLSTSSRRHSSAKFLINQSAVRLVTFGASICLLATLLTAPTSEAGRLQDFIQSIVGNSNKNSNSNNNNNNNNESSSDSNSNSNSESSDSNSNSNSNSDSDSSSDQQLTPMMSAMNPFMRYPSFYGSFGQPNFGGYPGMSFSNPMAAMSSFSPMTMSASSFGAFSPASFSPATFGSTFGASANPLSSYSSIGNSGAINSYGGSNTGMSASSLSNAFAQAPNFLTSGGYTPYYGKK